MDEANSIVKANKGNKFNLAEFAGSLGDLGTLIPFLIVYIYTIKFDPFGILLGFGIFNIIFGWYYKTPIPVQPMKAIGTLAVAKAAIITPAVIWGAGIFTGVFWLIASFSGLLDFLRGLVNRTIVKGIVLGLGIIFLMEALKMMRTGPFLSIFVIVVAFVLSKAKKIPVVFIILLFGIGTEAYYHLDKLTILKEIRPAFKLPTLNVKLFTLNELIKGISILALPQIPLTLGNGIFAVASENNELFPERSVTPKKVAISTGIMNLFSPIFGGIPMCHGAGGIAGHVKFGARTGGATIILGLFLVVLAIFFHDAVPLIIKLIPAYILGVMIFLVSIELIKSAIRVENNIVDIGILIITALLAIWNSGVALLVGIVITKLLLPRIIKEKENQKKLD